MVSLAAALANSKSPFAPNLFLAFDRIEMRDSLGARRDGVNRIARCANNASSSSVPGNTITAATGGAMENRMPPAAA